MLGRSLKLSIPGIRFVVQPSNTNRRLMSIKSFKIPTKKFSEIGPVGYSLLLVPAITGCLGTWQVKRRQWKLNLIEELKEKTTAPPIELPENLEDVEELEYHRVKIRGVFLHDREMYIRPRSLLTSGGEATPGGGLLSSGQTGAHVVTPFLLAGREDTILVNRGWVPKHRISPQTRPASLIREEVELVGIVRKTESRAPLGPKHSENDSNAYWLFRDVHRMARAADCAPVFVDACVDANGTPREGEPIAGQTKVTLRNEHLSYIVTWFSLSASTSFLWFMKFVMGKTFL